jgi:hypothetical protein
MRVSRLNFGIAWRSPRSQWAPNAFPAIISLPGWRLEVSQHRIAADPDGTKFFEEGSARADLEPHLDAWTAELAVVHDLPAEYWFEDADLVPIVFLGASAHARVTIGDRVRATDDVRVQMVRSEVPKPTWVKPPSPVARNVREYCLLPLRGERRMEADAAYWLSTQLRSWAGSEVAAAARLNVSHKALERMGELSGGAYDRKVGRGSQPLTEEERSFLRRMIELAVWRLHLYEVGEPVGNYLPADQI